uniref:Zinc finger Ran-binding domain-containing protein 2 n=1 Tax=Denticeps clupeoides TaxID=299321 RepID=A0AAY4EUG2_9TELE
MCVCVQKYVLLKMTQAQLVVVKLQGLIQAVKVTILHQCCQIEVLPLYLSFEIKVSIKYLRPVHSKTIENVDGLLIKAESNRSLNSRKEMWPYMWNILRNWKEIAFEAPSEVWQALGRTGFFKRPFIGRRGVFRPILGNVGLRAGTKMSGKSFRVSDGDWICPDKKCGNVNFARRTSCNRCGREKTTEAKLMKSGGTEIGKTLAEKSRGLFSANDWQCKTCGNVNWARRSECNMCNTPKYAKLEERTGYGGGFNERENVEYIEREESDGEYDEFGRKKKKYRGKNVAGSTKENEKKPEKDDREEEEEDDDEEGDLSKYKLDDDDEDDDADLSRSRSRSSSSSRSRSRSRSSSQDNGRSRRSRSR